jgi:hypothetical protein
LIKSAAYAINSLVGWKLGLSTTESRRIALQRASPPAVPSASESTGAIHAIEWEMQSRTESAFSLEGKEHGDWIGQCGEGISGVLFQHFSWFCARFRIFPHPLLWNCHDLQLWGS